MGGSGRLDREDWPGGYRPGCWVKRDGGRDIAVAASGMWHLYADVYLRQSRRVVELLTLGRRVSAVAIDCG